MLAWYSALLALRRAHPALGVAGTLEMGGRDDGEVLELRRRAGTEELLLLANLDRAPRDVAPAVEGGRWRRLLDAGEERFGGIGAAGPAELDRSASRASPSGGAAVPPPSEAHGAATAAGGAVQRLRLPPHAVVLYRRESS
jgi:hypothetical protein